MREHQIVITLKPEQFLQVQKLAKNAGAKSMGMFVRQKLLLALGIEGNLATAQSPELEPLIGELKRLHVEMREFVNESLAMYSDGLLNGTAGTPMSIDAPITVADPAPTPPAQAPNPAPAPEPAVEQKSFPKAFMEAKPAAPAPLPTEDLGALEKTSDEKALEELADRDNEEDGVPAIAATTSSQDPVAPIAPAATRAATSVTDEEAEEDPASSMVNDDMEATANKTFAISPRLGPIEPKSDENTQSGQKPPSFRTVERKKWIPSNEDAYTPNPVQGQKAEAAQDPATPETTQKETAKGPEAQPNRYGIQARHSKRDPLAELLSSDDFEKEPKQARQYTSSSSAEAAEDETDETFDIPLSLMARTRQMQEQQPQQVQQATENEPPAEEQSNAKQQDQTSQNLNSNSDDKDQSASKAHPHHSRIHAAETNFRSDEEKPQTTGAQESKSTPHTWQPLENPDDDTPFSGGPPPKKRQ